MPIYEFYCSRCHAIFSFFSAAVDTASRPDCPDCGLAGLERKPSAFATLRHGGAEAEDALDGIPEDRLDSVLDSMAGELAALEDGADDPRALSRVLRRIGEASGLEPGPKLEAVLARLESGEDPDALEDELGAELDDEDSLAELFRAKRAVAGQRAKPRVDDKLYFL